MQDTTDIKAAGSDKPRRLFAFNGGFFLQKRLRRILSLAGYDLRLGRPTPEDLIAIWGNSPTAHRGLKAAEKTGASKLFLEDAFLRSLFPGRVAKEPPIGLLIDGICPHFDPSQPSDLENLLKHHALDDTVLLDRARGGIARLRETHLTKYAAVNLDQPLPAAGYVLVIDQTRNDAAVRASNANEARFQEMLVLAQEENPGAPVLIKTHPETQAGTRAGYYGPEHETDRVTLCTSAHSPWSLLEGAVAVYTVSSQMGFEAILAGHKPRVFGQPFYAGWDLTQDEFPLYRRQRRLTRAQLFAAAMILYPTWYDPCRDQLCDFEVALEQMAAQARAWHEDRKGWNAFGMRLWKRKPLQKFFGQHAPMTFDRHGKKSAPHMVWANKAGPDNAVKLEDGFLRSRGLGAALVPPLSLVCDDLGIYYDPSQESRLEHWIAKRETLRIDQERRALALRSALRKSRVSKYNLSGQTPDLPSGHVILVPGQVEDDASILKGTSEITTNIALLRATRAANPAARILFKPHPDVEAGLRQGAIDRNEAEALADMVLEQADMGYLLDHVDEIWTMTSLTGFEALIRGCKVTTFGAPFYAGWGLTQDLGTPPARRRARPSLTGLIHATLIDYPRYHDPVSSLACTPELIIERLQAGDIPHPGLGNRLLSKLQGQFSSYHHLWRR